MSEVLIHLLLVQYNQCVDGWAPFLHCEGLKQQGQVAPYPRVRLPIAFATSLLARIVTDEIRLLQCLQGAK